MSGVKHTPGPLAIFPERDRQWLWVMDELGTKRVARVVLYDGLEDEMEANARLIAAAPDLLEALEALLRVETEWGDPTGPEWDNARAAIARARGEQSPNHSDQKEVGNG